MTWVQIILLILKLLKEFQDKQNGTAEDFAAFAVTSLPTANGDLLKWIWENREEIVKFAKMLYEMFKSGNVSTLSAELTELQELLESF